MKTFALLLLLSLFAASAPKSFAQTTTPQPPPANEGSEAATLSSQREALLQDLRALEAEERNSANDTYVPTPLAPVAGPINPFRQSRSLLALSESAVAVEPLSGETALEILEEVVRSANQNRIVSENGNPNFNTDVFMLLARRDEPRVRHAAGALRDRLQRIAALAALHRGRAESLVRSSRVTRVSTHRALP